MTLMKIDRNLFPRFSSLWEDYLTKEMSDTEDCSPSCNTPAVNITETPNSFVLHLALPGMKREDLKVDLDNGILTISAESKETHNFKQEGSKMTRKEFCYLNFKRSFTLPESVVVDKVQASYENGILAITIPKHEPTKLHPIRQIAIQ